MISFHYETSFAIQPEAKFKEWVSQIILSENKRTGIINFIFCDDVFLHDINLKYLKHDTYTDIISFDYSEEDLIAGDIFISVERLKENALKYGVSFGNELKRVMAHGILHYCGFNDKTAMDNEIMRQKEDEKITLFDTVD